MIKKRLEHAVFLMGMLFITLLTSSANAFAQDTHTVTGGEGIKTVSNIANGTNSFTLIAEEGYTLPTALGTLTMDETALTSSDASDPADTYTYTPANGNVVINKEGGIIADITFTAGGVEKDIATLATFTYSVTNGVQDQAVTDFTTDDIKESYTVDLGAYQIGTTVVTLNGTVTEESGATKTTKAGTIATGASITVTAKDGTEKTYTVAFTVATAKITSVTEPKDQTLDQIYATFELAKAKLPQTMVITAEDGTSSLDLVWTMKSGSYNPASGATNTFVWTATVPGTLDATDVSVTGEVIVTNFTTPLSTDNKLSALTYLVPAGTETPVTGFKPEDAGPQTYTVNTIPFGTKTVSVKATAAQGAQVKDDNADSPFTVILNGTTVVPLVLTVTSESGVARTVTINFSAVQDKITSVTPPVAPTLDKKLATAAEVIALLPTMLAITTEGESVTELPLTWALKTNTTFTDVSGEINIFTWTATPLTLNVNNQALTGDIDVINALVPETGTIGDITVSTPAVQFGDGSTTTTAGTITVATTVQDLTFNGVTVTTDVIIPVTGTTTISLKGTNDIKKITNNGTLTLKNATTATSSSIATRAVANTGAVKAVENNGTFTDETGTIFTVGGTKGLEITTLPTNELNVTAATAQLSIVASTGATYQWMKGTEVANGTSTAATLTVAKADAGSYTCVVKNAGGTATLVTPPVTVSFKTTTPPVTPPTTTYTVSLPAVTGATFSKGVSTTVTEGGDFAFQITLDKDYNLSVPVVKTSRNNEVITAVAGVYTVSNVRGDLIVTVTGITKNIPTGIDDVNSGTRIWAAGSTLHIFTEATENVYVFNASGVLQKQFRTPGGDYTTQMNEGLYIVKIGNYTQKVIIK